MYITIVARNSRTKSKGSIRASIQHGLVSVPPVPRACSQASDLVTWSHSVSFLFFSKIPKMHVLFRRPRPSIPPEERTLLRLCLNSAILARLSISLTLVSMTSSVKTCKVQGTHNRIFPNTARCLGSNNHLRGRARLHRGTVTRVARPSLD